jgi:hypothetical protein
MRTSAQGAVDLPTRTSRDARRWIERQLRWERTLAALRTRREATREVRTAA